MSSFEVTELINGLNAFPGHREKLLSAFPLIKQMYIEKSKPMCKEIKSNENYIKEKEIPIKVIQADVEEEYSNVPSKPSLGVGYFLGKNVSNEVEELVIKYQNIIGEKNKAENHKENDANFTNAGATWSDSNIFDEPTVNNENILLLCKCFAHALHRHINFSHNKNNVSELDTMPENPIKNSTKDNEKLKEIVNDTFIGNAHPEMLSSFLTIEEHEEDLSYTQTHLEGFLSDCKLILICR